MGKSSKGGRGRGRSSGSAGSSGSRSSSSGGSKSSGSKSSGSSSSGGSKSSGSSGRSSGRSSSSAGSSGTRSGLSGSNRSVTSQSSGVSSSSSSISSQSVSSTPATSTQGPTSTGPAQTRSVIGPSGNVQQIRNVTPQQAATIQAVYDRQRMTKSLNESKQNMVAAIRNAKTSKDAMMIRAKFVSQNPALTSMGTVKDVRKRVNNALDKGFVKLGPTGEPIGKVNPRTNLYDSKGQKIGSTTGQSVDSEFNFFEVKKPTTSVKQMDMFSVSSPKTPVSSLGETEFLSDSQKAFGFLPSPSEIKGTDEFAQLGKGVLRGSSNVITSFFNIGEYGRSAITQTEAKPKGYYKTPITQAELTFFGVAEKGLKGQYESADQAGTDLGIGFGKAKDTIFADPLGSVGSFIEAGPYVIGGGIIKGGQTIGKLSTGFFKVSKTTKADSILSPGIKVSKKDYFDGFFRDTKRTVGLGTKKTKAVTPAFTKQDMGLGKALGMDLSKTTKKTGDFGLGTAKKVTKKQDDYLGKFFPSSKGGQQLMMLQKPITKTKLKTQLKTKTKTKQVQKQSSGLKFFSPTKIKAVAKTKSKVKSKQKLRAGIIPMFKTPTRQRTPLKSRVKQGLMFGSIPATAATTSLLFPPPTSTARVSGGGIGPRLLRGKRSGGGNRKKKGKVIHQGWNVNIKKVGSYYGGPAYVQSKSKADIDRYFAVKGKKAKSGKAFSINGVKF